MTLFITDTQLFYTQQCVQPIYIQMIYKNISTLQKNGVPSTKNLLELSPHEVDLIDNAELLVTLNISMRTAQRWRADGIIPYIRVRRKIYYKRGDVNKLMNSNYFKNPKI